MAGGAPTQPEDFIGEGLPGGYRLERHLASGGFAWIFYARDKQGVACAVKVPYQISRDTLRLFEREIKVMRSLPPSAYRVKYVADGMTFKGVPFLAMEFVDGPTLTHVLSNTPMWTIEDSCNFMLQLCAACADLHNLGIADRDLKPDNVLLTKEWQVKLVDFGLVKDAQGLLKLFEAEDILHGRHFAENLEKGMLAGSPEWIAPEQLHDASVTDEALAQTDTWTDVYAMGLIFYRLLTGRALFPFRPQSRDQAEYARDLLAYLEQRAGARDEQLRRPAEIPMELWAVIARALRNDPRRRQHDAIVLGQEIEHFLSTGEAYEPFDDEKTTLGNAAQFLAAYAKPRSVPPSQRPPVPPPAQFTPISGEEEPDATAIAVMDELVAEHTPPDARAVGGYQTISGRHRIGEPRPAGPPQASPPAERTPAPQPMPTFGPAPSFDQPVVAPPRPVSVAPSGQTPTLILVVLIVLGLVAIGSVGALIATLRTRLSPA